MRLKRGAARELLGAATVADPGPCLLWPGGRNKLGYGSIHIGRYTLAHRAAYEMKHGHCPPLLRHTCDNPACYNPAHLVPGTHQDNMDDMVSRGRQCKGEDRATKLTAENVAYIRANHVKGKNRFDTGNTTEFAERFGVCREFILDIVRGDKWVE